MCSKEGESPTDKEELEGLKPVASAEDDGLAPKEKKKKKHREEKRKRSCSTDSTSSSSSHRRHKKKKRRKTKDSPPSPKVNPIFLWVKQDHTKIVEVLCEDYDKRNRIKLTKTAGGWVAIPRTNMFCPEPPKEPVKEAPEPLVEQVKEVEAPTLKESVVVEEENLMEESEENDEPSEVKKEPECTEVKCCPEVNVDENHNNEVETPEECTELCRNLEDDVEEIKVPEDTPDDEPIEIPDEVEEGCTEIHQDSCVNLMNELADMCFVETLKEEESKVLDDIYTFVPSPAEGKDEVKTYTPVKETKKSPTPEPAPINLVVHPERETAAETEKDMKLEPLKQSDLESLDILWRLPEGTTISHSKPLADGKPATPPPKPAAPTFSQPVQVEPLNLGKPKPKVEKKPPKPSEDSKLMELLKSDEKIQSNPLDQLKEVLSDPDLTVPDPLLVPRARLSALIANPAKEIPKLLAQNRELKYPKIDADLMVVSLAHLQSIIQKTGKEDDLKLYQQQVMSGYDKIDPTTAALNQMLWLPYLSQLEAKHNQELMAMLYPHYMYPQPYPTAPPLTRYPYPRQPWPRPETSKSKPAQKHTETKHREPKLHETKLHESKFQEQKYAELKYHEAKYHDLKFHDAKYQDTKFHDTKLQDTKFHDIKFQDTKFLDTKFQDAKFHDTKLHESKFHDTKLHESKYHEPKFQESKYPELKYTEAKPHGETTKPAAKPKLKVRDNLVEPKLKVRDNLVEPNQRTSLLKFDPTAPFLPPVGVPPNSNLWHPLFSRNAGIDMRWFTPKRVRTGSTRVGGTGRRQ